MMFKIGNWRNPKGINRLDYAASAEGAKQVLLKRGVDQDEADKVIDLVSKDSTCLAYANGQAIEVCEVL
jgi:hypothetical protein